MIHTYRAKLYYMEKVVIVVNKLQGKILKIKYNVPEA